MVMLISFGPTEKKTKYKHHDLSYALQNSTNQAAREYLLTSLLFSLKIVERASILKPAIDIKQKRARFRHLIFHPPCVRFRSPTLSLEKQKAYEQTRE